MMNLERRYAKDSADGLFWLGSRSVIGSPNCKGPCSFEQNEGMNQKPVPEQKGAIVWVAMVSNMMQLVLGRTDYPSLQSSE